MNEPLADEEWKSPQIEERTTQEKRLEVLWSWLERSKTVDSWYVRRSLRFSSVLNVSII